MKETAQVEIHLGGEQISGLKAAEILTGSSAAAMNSFEKPKQVISQKFDAVRIQNGVVQADLPPLSLVALTLSLS
jgi:alpha-L-arabinofuranosidase